jgi:hypothetical protein
MAYDPRTLDNYIPVAQRIADFREKHPDGSLRPWNPAEPWRLIQAEGFDRDGNVVQQTFIVVVAAAYRHEHDTSPGVGMAWEIFPGRTNYTRGSELQNAETSAIGRAIIAVGASDSMQGVSSREEIRNRVAEQDSDPAGELISQERAMRRKPPEVDEHGAATFAEQTRMMTGREPGTTRSKTMAVDDPWMNGPAGLAPVDDPEDRPGTCSPDQIKGLKAAYAQLGITDRAVQLAKTAGLLGIDAPPTHTRLSYRQAGDLLVILRNLNPKLPELDKEVTRG